MLHKPIELIEVRIKGDIVVLRADRGQRMTNRDTSEIQQGKVRETESSQGKQNPMKSLALTY